MAGNRAGEEDEEFVSSITNPLFRKRGHVWQPILAIIHSAKA